MPITFRCKNGHKIKADDRHAGVHSKCPKCKVLIVVPEPAPLLPPPRAMTESGLMRVLGSAPELPAMPKRNEDTVRKCPRCKKRLSRVVTLCNHCQLYVGFDTGDEPRSDLPM